MNKLDFKKQEKHLYTSKVGQWDSINVPAMRFLMIDGVGDPNGPIYARALSALYPLAYTLKFASKEDGADFVVSPLEALWWANDPTAFVRGERSEWRWTAMLRMPTTVTDDKFVTAREAYRAKWAKKKVEEAVPLDEVRLDDFTEGLCLQTLHIGAYTDEAPVLADLHDRVMPEKAVTFNGPHHEVYLSDPRRVVPEKLRTILRQPIQDI